MISFVSDLISLYIDRSDFFLRLFFEHIYLTLVSVLIITVIGIATGLYMTRNQKTANIIITAVNFVYTIPSIALFGVLVSVTGIGDKSAILALTIYGLLPVIRNTYTGIREVDKEIIEAAIGMGSTDWQLLWKIQFPLALPMIMTGFRTMVIMTIALGGIASFIGAGGLGVAIWRGITTNFDEMTVAGSLLVALLAIFTDLFLGIVEKKISIKILGTNYFKETI